MRVLIVEDDPALADLLRRTLREAAMAADIAPNGGEGLTALAVNEYDLAVLDVSLPDIDGFEVCRRHRERGGRTPILMLTARAGLDDRIHGLDAGADDYLSKPFAIEELLARLRALARRPVAALDVVLSFADLELDTRSLTARRGGASIRLTAREYALLEYLMRNPERVVSRTQILEHVWDDNFDPVGNAVDVLVGRLRRRIHSDGQEPLIHTIRSRGYILSLAEPADGA
ncbi:MAG TPA: response regulator transcription factor [Gemmatimonadales bacterium]|jgi:two-component system copper resistance phosphate regulon response regulator CusR